MNGRNLAGLPPLGIFPMRKPKQGADMESWQARQNDMLMRRIPNIDKTLDELLKVSKENLEVNKQILAELRKGHDNA